MPVYRYEKYRYPRVKVETRAKNRARALFRLADRDGSGVVDADELKWVLERCFLNDEFDVDELMFELDEDYSGEVDLEEFLSYFANNKALVRRMATRMEQHGETADRVILAALTSIPWLSGIKALAYGEPCQPVEGLVERFDIEPFSDFSAK